jgi:hypothetical protein
MKVELVFMSGNIQTFSKVGKDTKFMKDFHNENVFSQIYTFINHEKSSCVNFRHVEQITVFEEKE